MHRFRSEAHRHISVSGRDLVAMYPAGDATAHSGAGIVFELSGAVASLAASGRGADLIAPLFLLGLALAS